MAAIARCHAQRYPLPMNLEQAIFKLSNLSDRAILFVERIEGQFLPESRSVILELSDEELEVPVADIAKLRAPGTEYFLEAFIIQDMVQEWEGDPVLDQASRTQLIKTIINYAENDA